MLTQNDVLNWSLRVSCIGHESGLIRHPCCLRTRLQNIVELAVAIRLGVFGILLVQPVVQFVRSKSIVWHDEG